MLDVVKELVPLLEGASEGAFWLVVWYFAVVLAQSGMWLFFAWLLLKTGRNVAEYALGYNPLNNYNMYQWDDSSEGVDAIFTKRQFQRLLVAIKEAYATSGLITDWTLKDAVNDIKKTQRRRNERKS